MIRRAALSGRWAEYADDERYRYALGIPIGSTKYQRPLVVIGLNPSTATEDSDDPTIRRCCRFARDLGADGLVMLNLYAWRSTDPHRLSVLLPHVAVGPLNDEAILRHTADAHLVVAAWGAFTEIEDHLYRVNAVYQALAAKGRQLHALGLTKDGHPRHPLYLPASARPAPWPGKEA